METLFVSIPRIVRFLWSLIHNSIFQSSVGLFCVLGSTFILVSTTQPVELFTC